MIMRRVCILVVSVMLFSAVAVSGAQKLPDVVAVVNGEKITKDQLISTAVDWHATMVLEQMVNFRIIDQEAKKAGVVITQKQIDAKIEEIKKNLRPGQTFDDMLMRNGLTLNHAYAVIKMQLQTEGVLKKSMKVTSKDLEGYRHVQHVLIRLPNPSFPGAEEQPEEKEKIAQQDQEAKAKIDKIAQEIKDGLAFEEAAKKYSEDPGTKANGGDLGFITRGPMAPEFEEAVFKMKTGEISEPIKSPYGYHLIKLVIIGNEATGEDKKKLEEEIIQRKIGEKYQPWLMYITNKAKVKNILSPEKPKPAPKPPQVKSVKPGVVTPPPPPSNTESGTVPEPAPEDIPPPPPDSGTGAQVETSPAPPVAPAPTN